MSTRATAAVTTGSAEKGATFRIASMDCAGEEAEIRGALEPIADIASLRFQLGARTLTITAPPSAVALAEAAIRGAGFDPQGERQARAAAGDDA